MSSKVSSYKIVYCIIFKSIYFLSLSFFIFHGYAEKKTKMQDLVASNESYGIKDLEDDFKGHDINIFNYASILDATMDFSSENKLGQGGYGPVYKVT